MVVRSWMEDRCVVVSVVGELDAGGAPRLRAELDQALSPGSPPNLVIDLTEAPFCDSVGLGLLVSALTRVRGHLVLAVAPGMIARLLAITNLDRHFAIRGSLEEATQALARMIAA